MDDINIKHSVEFTNSNLESALDNLTSALSKFGEMGAKSNPTAIPTDNTTPQERAKIRIAEYQQKIDAKAIKDDKNATEQLAIKRLDTENKIRIIREQSSKSIKTIELQHEV